MSCAHGGTGLAMAAAALLACAHAPQGNGAAHEGESGPRIGAGDTSRANAPPTVSAGDVDASSEASAGETGSDEAEAASALASPSASLAGEIVSGAVQGVLGVAAVGGLVALLVVNPTAAGVVAGALLVGGWVAVAHEAATKHANAGAEPTSGTSLASPDAAPREGAGPEFAGGRLVSDAWGAQDEGAGAEQDGGVPSAR